MRTIFLSLILISASLVGCGLVSSGSDGYPPPSYQTGKPYDVPIYGYRVINRFPHNKKSFTQGLAFHDGYLYESVGERKKSAVLRVNLKNGKSLMRQRVPDKYFAEGLTILDDKIYQISWNSGIGWIYRINDFKKIGEFTYAGSGWGLADDGENLFLSDGTHVIRVVDPRTMKTIRTITVLDEKGRPLSRLNELEYIKGELWANVWRSENSNRPNYIARINPKNGKLNSWLNLDKISPKDSKNGYEKSLNGIAYDAENDRIFVTGKNWENLFEIKPLTTN